MPPILVLSEHFNQLTHPRMPRVGNNRNSWTKPEEGAEQIKKKEKN